jgi:hypothetical protein
MQEMKWGTSMQFPCSGWLRILLLVNSLHLRLSAFYRVVTVYQSLRNVDMSMVYLSQKPVVVRRHMPMGVLVKLTLLSCVMYRCREH